MKRRYLRFLATLLLAGPLFLLMRGPAGAMETLSQNQQAMLAELVIPAYQSGGSAPLIDAVTRLTTRMNSADLAAVDAYLAEQKLPKVGEMLLDARSTAAAQSRESQFLAPRPRPIEKVLVLTAFHDRYQEAVRDLQSLPAMSDQAKQDRKWSDYESVLWSLRQARQRAAQLGQVARYVQDMAALKVRVNDSDLTDAQRAALEVDYGHVLENLATLHRRLQESDLELRARRLTDAVATLRDSSVLKDRLVAAHVIDADGMILTTALRDVGKVDARPFLNSRFNDPAIRDSIREQVEVGRELAGDMLEKSRRLFAGVHWWLRGRYGRGVAFYGLVKGEQARNNLTAQNWLYMPNEIPRNDEADSESGYDYPDRRHYYTWQYETRTLQVRGSVVPRENTGGLARAGNRSNATGQAKPTASVKISSVRGFRGLQGSSSSYFAQSGSGGGSPFSFQLSSADVAFDRYGWTVADLYKKYGIDYKKPKPRSGDDDYRQPTAPRTIYTETYIPDQDPYLVNQLVGLYEYALALEHFDTLVTLCDEPTLQAVDQLIAERDELVVEVNLSRNVELQPSHLSELPLGPGDSFRRRGLRWVTALARAEVAAMLLGFANVDDAFSRLAKSYDLVEYKELAQDGMRSHYWSLRNDASLQVVLQGEADANRTLAHLRRLLIAEGFLNAAALLSRDDYTPPQVAELTRWKSQTDQLQELLAKRIADLHTVRVEND